MLRRARGPSVEDAAQAAGWHVYEGEYDSRPLTARFNIALREARDLASYPIQMGVAVSLNDPDTRGMPGPRELEQIAMVEEQIVAAVGGRAVLVGAITTNSMREFVLYTGSAEWIQAFDHALQSAVSGHDVQVMARKDPDWAVYKQFAR